MRWFCFAVSALFLAVGAHRRASSADARAKDANARENRTAVKSNRRSSTARQVSACRVDVSFRFDLTNYCSPIVSVYATNLHIFQVSTHFSISWKTLMSIKTES